MSFKDSTGDYYSNCMIEAIKAKIKWKNQIKCRMVKRIKSKKGTRE